MAEAGWEQALFHRVAGGGQAPRGYVQSGWSSDRPENCPQDNMEPDSSVNLYRGQSAHSGRTPPLVGGAPHRPPSPRVFLYPWFQPGLTCFIYLRSEQEQVKAVRPWRSSRVAEAIVPNV